MLLALAISCVGHAFLICQHRGKSCSKSAFFICHRFFDYSQLENSWKFKRLYRQSAGWKLLHNLELGRRKTWISIVCQMALIVILAKWIPLCQKLCFRKRILSFALFSNLLHAINCIFSRACYLLKNRPIF